MGAIARGGRIAVLGGRGDGGPLGRLGETVVMFGSPGDAGTGPVRRLEAALQAGSFVVVVVLARWGAHSATRRVRKVCRATGTRFVVWPGGLSSLAIELAPLAGLTTGTECSARIPNGRSTVHRGRRCEMEESNCIQKANGALESGQTKRCIIVAIEGLDGVGKSTMVNLLAVRLGAVVIRNPPATLAAERAGADRLEPEARRRWYLNANRVAMEQAMAAALAGKPVVLDRSIASTICFGAAERGKVASRDDIPFGFPLPDSIFLLSVPEPARRARHKNRGSGATSEEDRLVADDAFRERVLAGYRNICTSDIDACGTPESIVLEILIRLPVECCVVSP
jgi:dTMP kinase